MLTRFILFPLSFLYGFIIRLRTLLYDLRILPQHKPVIPSIVVGNISTGGTGKTPMIKWLLGQLSDLEPVVLSRGYGRSTRGLRLVDINDDASVSGDEPLEIKQAFPATPVVVCEDRLKGIAFIKREFPSCKLVLLDDGFQHRRLKPDVTLVLIDYPSLLKPMHLLPYGNLREPFKALERANHVILTKCPETLPAEKLNSINKMVKRPVIFSKITHDSLLIHALNKNKTIDSGQLKMQTVYCLSGIANPGLFVDYVTSICGYIKPLTYPDHYPYSRPDYERWLELHKKETSPHVFVCTQKDAVKLRNFMQQNMDFPLYVLSSSVAFAQENDTLALIKNIRAHVGKHSGNSGLS